MEKSTKNTIIAISAVTAVSVIGVILWRIFRNPTESINQTTEDFTNSKAQAARFYELLGVHRVNGFAVATPTFFSSTLKKIALLAINIDDWSVIQNTFTSLCGGNYTVLEAAKTALSTENFQVFTNYIQDALRKKRIVCNANIGTTLKNANRYGGIAAEQFARDVFVGRCQGSDDNYYYYISENDGNTYAAPKNEFKLI